MLKTLLSVWALLIGIVFIMLGNGMHFTLIGIRGDLEGFSATALSVVASGYFIGFLSGARLTPHMIRRVGHVRVFAALASFMSAALIAFALFADPIFWTALRILIGFCMSGVYVTAESWLNDASTNENRGQILSAYMLAQTSGIIGAQGLLTLGDAQGAFLFIGASILVSISFGPILLSVSPTPAAELTRAMPIKDLFRASPLGTVGVFFLGIVYAIQAGMGAVYGAQIGLSANEISLFMAMLFAGTLILQYPFGWLSDRMDRRKLIFLTSIIAVGCCLFGALYAQITWAVMVAAFLSGGVTTPLYALLLAYTNDTLAREDMPAASGGIVMLFGIGAISGPMIAGWAMEHFGAVGFWAVLAMVFAVVSVYALYRMTQRPVVPTDETDSYVGISPGASPVAVEAASTWAADQSNPNSKD